MAASPTCRRVMIDGTVSFVEGDDERQLYLEICRRYYDNDADNEQGFGTFHGSE